MITIQVLTLWYIYKPPRTPGEETLKRMLLDLSLERMNKNQAKGERGRDEGSEHSPRKGTPGSRALPEPEVLGKPEMGQVDVSPQCLIWISQMAPRFSGLSSQCEMRSLQSGRIPEWWGHCFYIPSTVRNRLFFHQHNTSVIWEATLPHPNVWVLSLEILLWRHWCPISLYACHSWA